MEIQGKDIKEHLEQNSSRYAARGIKEALDSYVLKIQKEIIHCKRKIREHEELINEKLEGKADHIILTACYEEKNKFQHMMETYSFALFDLNKTFNTDYMAIPDAIENFFTKHPATFE